MYIHTWNILLELVARTRYLFLRYLQKAEPIGHIEYRHHRWYKLDGHRKVVKISMTYFDLMQPYWVPHSEFDPIYSGY